MGLGARVLDRLTDLGISQSELARRVGISQPSVNALIHRNKTGSRNLHKIARALGTTPAYLTGETDDPDKDAPPEPVLTADEAEMLEGYKALAPKDRAAVLHIVASMNGVVMPSTQIHDRRQGYRGEDEGGTD